MLDFSAIDGPVGLIRNGEGVWLAFQPTQIRAIQKEKTVMFMIRHASAFDGETAEEALSRLCSPIDTA